MAQSGFDAVILAGGRSSRLGGEPKALLRFNGQSLLRRTLDSLRAARRIALVGPDELRVELEAFIDAEPETTVVLTREDPPFSGPAAGIGAAINVLRRGIAKDDDGGAAFRAPLTLIFACDMPALGTLPQLLLDAAERNPAVQLVLPVDADGRTQPLASCIDSVALDAAVAGYGPGGLAGMPVRKLLEGLESLKLPLTSTATADVDTWDDAQRFGIAPPAP
jgi:molybdopterin-guanine dinucleotide biosynthesis protein A